MKEWLRTLSCGILLSGMAGLAGCAPVEPLPPPPTTPVSIATFESATGKWSGILRSIPALRHDDWVTLTIGNDGSYEFVSIREIGIFQGKGTFTILDGKLRAETERGSSVVTLYKDGGRRMLKVEAATKDGVQYSAQLTPTK